MKKFISSFLILAMITVVACGCGGGSNNNKYTDSQDNVTLKWVMPWSNQTDHDIVNDKVNEMLSTLLPNTKVDLICDSSMGDKWQLWMAGKQNYDIAHTGFAIDLAEEITKKSFMSLNQLIDEYAPTIKKEYEGIYNSLYLTGKYKDDLYAIPCVQYHTKETIALTTKSNVLKYLDVNALVTETHSNTKTTEKVYEILDDFLKNIKKNEGTPLISVDELYKNKICKRGYTFIGGSQSNICYDPYSDKPEIINFFDTEEFKTYIKWANKWYNDGYISKDILTGTSVGTQSTVSGFGGVYTSRFGADDNWIINSANGSDIVDVVLDNPENDIASSYNIGSLLTYLSIPTTSQNPVRAIKLLELLRTEKGKDLLNLMTYGIEGTHYEKTGDNSIKAFDYVSQGNSDSKYGIANWMMGNMFNMYTCYPYDDSVRNYGEDYYKNKLTNIKKSSMYGYCFDTDTVLTQMPNIYSINKEYETQLAYGVAKDYESFYKEMQSKLKAAGIEDCIKEFQKQADKYISSEK